MEIILRKEYSKFVNYWLISLLSLIGVIVIVGGLTRLTDSGLSITTWDIFQGILPPLTNNQWEEVFSLYKKIPQYFLLNENMTMSEFKVIYYWEYIHRILGRLLGLLFFIPFIYIYFKNILSKKYNQNLFFLFLLILLQGAVGWYMVKSGLVDKVDVSHFRLSIHLLLAFFILSLIYWNYLKINGIKKIHKNINPIIPFMFLVLIFAQIAIGAFVSGMDAGKIYNSWPLMGETYFPNDNNLYNLFEISVFSDPSLVQFIHRNLAYLIGIIYLLIFYKIYKDKFNGLYKAINILGFFIILQIILGVITIINGAQIYIASMHQISSIFLISSCVYFLYINTKSN